MREKTTALKSVCGTYENPQKCKTLWIQPNSYRSIKIIIRSYFLKLREAERITRNTIWELILPTGCSALIFAGSPTRGRPNQQVGTERRLGMRNVCGKYAHGMRKCKQSHSSTPAAWQTHVTLLYPQNHKKKQYVYWITKNKYLFIPRPPKSSYLCPWATKNKNLLC